MPTKDELLDKFTHKSDGHDLEKRVFYTLSSSFGKEKNDAATQAHRNSKLLSLLIATLHEAGMLSDEQIDDLLLEAVL